MIGETGFQPFRNDNPNVRPFYAVHHLNVDFMAHDIDGATLHCSVSVDGEIVWEKDSSLGAS